MIDAQVIPDPLFLFPFWSQVNKADDPVFFMLYEFCEEVGRKAARLDIFANKIVYGFSLLDVFALVVRKQDNKKIGSSHLCLHNILLSLLISTIFNVFPFLHIYN